MNWRAWCAMALQVLIAGATFHVARHGLQVFEPLHFIHWRVQGVALLFAVMLLILGRPLLPPREARWPLLRLGMLGGPCNQVLFFVGLARTTPTHAALIYALTPATILLWSWLAREDRPRPGEVIALGLAFSGVLILLAPGLSGAGQEASLTGDLLVVGGMLCWAAYSRGMQRWTGTLGAVPATAWAWLLAAAATVCLWPWLGTGLAVGAPGLSHWISFGYVLVLTSFVAYMLYGFGLERLGPARTAIFLNGQPVVAMVIGLALGHRDVGLRALIATALVVGGVVLMQRQRGRSLPTAARAASATPGSSSLA
ncbi:MAG: EamA family transporter [Candidatus Sericytochromatia bacterium]|nr:EamA family transporter [Candidatus Sericytochromatia bacterium]